MERVGVREFKQQTKELLERIREANDSVTITDHGRVVACVVPAKPRRHDPAATAAWLATIDDLAEELGRHWPEGVTAVDAVDDVRRDL